MKEIKKILILILMLFGAPAFGEDKVLEILTFDYPPLFGESKYSKEGLMVELAQSAFDSVGIKTKVKFLPIKRAMSQISHNEAIAYLGGIYSFDSVDRKNLEEFPLLRIRFVCFYLKERFPTGFTFTKLSDLKKYSIGVLAGGLTDTVGKANGLNVEGVNSLSSIFLKLNADRNDIGVAFELSVKSQIEELFQGNENKFEIYYDVPFVSTDATLLLNKKHPEYKFYSEKYKIGVKNIVKNGKWLSIMEKYYGKGKVPYDSKKLMEDVIKKY